MAGWISYGDGATDYKEQLRMRFEYTRYGFDYGAARVERLASHGGYVILGVTTPRQLLTVTVTPTGLIRVDEVRKNEQRR